MLQEQEVYKEWWLAKGPGFSPQSMFYCFDIMQRFKDLVKSQQGENQIFQSKVKALLNILNL